jgi:hypothetical protein
MGAGYLFRTGGFSRFIYDTSGIAAPIFLPAKQIFHAV